MAVEQSDTDTDTEPRAVPKRGLQIEAWIFLALTGFFFIASVIYTIFAGATEPVGVVALFLTTGLAAIIGSFLAFSSRRLESARPEDNEDAYISDGAGDVGFFSPGSYWPFAMALAAAFTAVSIAFFLVWMMVITIGFLLVAVCGLLFEYHRRAPSH